MNIPMIARRVRTKWLRNALVIAALLLIGAAVALSLASRPATTGGPAASIANSPAGQARSDAFKQAQAEVRDMTFVPVSTPAASDSAQFAAMQERLSELHNIPFVPVSTPVGSSRTVRGY